MEPTNIIIRPNNKNPQSNIKAYANVTFDGIMDINIRLIEGKHGLFLGMPNHKGKEPNQWFDDVRFHTNEERNSPGDKYKRELLAAIVQKYNETLPEGGGFDQTKTQTAAKSSGAGTAQNAGFGADDSVPF